jgi:hypothetical protein
MKKWTLGTLRALDLKYAKEGLHMHQRPWRAAMEILGAPFSMGVGGNPEVQEIMAAYEAMHPRGEQFLARDGNWSRCSRRSGSQGHHAGGFRALPVAGLACAWIFQ